MSSSDEFSNSDLGVSIIRGLTSSGLREQTIGRASSTTVYYSTTASILRPISNLSSAPETQTPGTASNSQGGDLLEGLIVPLYATIFILGVIGNLLVVITLAKNKRMRTVTNVYLLNLALSDLLLGVFCIPFTLLGQMLKNFVFGTTMCRLIPYFQAVSVSVSVWTLVAISLERYFAICRPLKSRRWQTRCHACKMIAVVWSASLVWNAPILAVSSLKDISGGRQKCREDWPSIAAERAFNIFLDVILLIIPLIIMTLAYSLIVTKLRRREIQHSSSCQRQLERTSSSATVNGTCHQQNSCASKGNAKATILQSIRQQRSSGIQPPSGYHQGVPQPGAIPQQSKSRRPSTRRKAEAVKLWLMRGMVQLPGSGTPRVVACRGRSGAPGPASHRRRTNKGTRFSTESREDDSGHSIVTEEHHDTTYTFSRHAIRSNYMDKSIEAKKKVIVMLCVVMLTFFVCWTPLYVIHTWYLFAPEFVYAAVGRTGISLIQLLAYWSSCCNPIIYCYMNRNFRQAVKSVSYECWSAYCGCGDETVPGSGSVARHCPNQGVNSEVSGNDSTIYLGRASIMARTEVVLLEAEDRV